jgi:molybdate transport system substrate-binding protein
MEEIVAAAGLSSSSLDPSSGLAARAVEIKVLSADVLTPVLSGLVEQFESATKIRTRLVLATTGAVTDRIESGEDADVTIMQRPAIRKLTERGVIFSERVVDIGRSSVAVGVAAGRARPVLASVDDFKRAVLGARLIGSADPAKGGGSAVYFAKLVERLALADQVKAKMRYPKPGHSAADLIAEGDVDFGIAQPMEILAKAGAELVGPLPAELQDRELFVFSAGILRKSARPDAAKALIRFLTAPAATTAIRAKGMHTD